MLRYRQLEFAGDEDIGLVEERGAGEVAVLLILGLPKAIVVKRR